ncbi:MAG: hypothetical protein JW917_03760 [Ignavibacteria bacterium]|nr:hypothetical protein [Ignavibacteria bacterium]
MDNKEPNIRLNSVLISAAVISFISIFPFLNLLNVVFCAGVVIGAFFGVSYYIKNAYQRNIPVEFKDGAFIGFLGGVLAAIVVSIFTLLATMLSGENPMTDVKEMMGGMIDMNSPEIQNMMQKFSDEFDRYGFSPTVSIITLIMYLITYSLFGFLGGILAYSIKTKKNKLN